MTVKSQNKKEPGQETTIIGVQDQEETILDRKKLLEITASLIEETHGRVTGERFRPREGDKERLAYLRALRELIALHADLLKASGAPAYQGLPTPPAEEDLEVQAALRKEDQNLKRLYCGLPLL
jgi:hypothetical protein